MALLKMGVIGTSKKEDERRVPIHPEHILRLLKIFANSLFLKKGMEPLSILKMKKLQIKQGEWQHEVKYYQILDLLL